MDQREVKNNGKNYSMGLYCAHYLILFELLNQERCDGWACSINGGNNNSISSTGQKTPGEQTTWET
jgi:hypothetical protein